MKQTISQLSIFLENRRGALSTILDVLQAAHIQLISCTIADTSEYGICRMICSEPVRAVAALKEAGIAVAVSDVFALLLENQPGRAARVLRYFSAEQINIPYLYSFLAFGKSILVFRTDDFEKSIEIFREHDLEYLTDEDLLKLEE